ncbi:MAG: hypothetical protein DMD81_27395 [Candidatus Rokuibacteriota bacterium]|nr:MAG: hypothetical protein DMD81_27395 [Candidatus Rokubacteria bacterium]
MRSRSLSAMKWRSIIGGGVSFILAGVAWEAFARSSILPAAITPSISDIGIALWGMIRNGTMFVHVGFTLFRILVGLALAIFVGVPIGMLMGRFRFAERFFLPLVSVLSPIPSLAWVPLFIIWFGLGNTASIALVFYAATFPMILNTWTGVRSVNRLWLRAASAMGAERQTLFAKVVLPGALPFVIAGFRQAFARSWIAVVGGEMIASTKWGLGWVVFDSKEFLNADVMMGTLVVIGLLGLGFERLIFQAVENRTVARWGMVTSAKA